MTTSTSRNQEAAYAAHGVAAKPTCVEAEYFRGGSLAYLAAWDVHRARVFGRCEQTTGIDFFDRLVDQVMTTEHYATARRVFWVLDTTAPPTADRSASTGSSIAGRNCA